MVRLEDVTNCEKKAKFELCTWKEYVGVAFGIGLLAFCSHGVIKAPFLPHVFILKGLLTGAIWCHVIEGLYAFVIASSGYRLAWGLQTTWCGYASLRRLLRIPRPVVLKPVRIRSRE